MKKLLKNEAFVIIFVLSVLISYTWYRSSNYYDKILKGTKYQVLKKDTPRKR